MVNEKTTETRKRIIRLLKEHPVSLSGEAISGTLGISRVAVWKHIQFLIDNGYSITSSRKGYQLSSMPDNLEPWSFPELPIKVFHLDHCSSTMEQARSLWASHAPPYVVSTETQERGWDHQGYDWKSPEGGLYMTLVLPPLFSLAEAGQYNTLMLRSVADILQRDWNLQVTVKDNCRLYYGADKICGVMTELYGPYNAHKAAAVGCGLYVLNEEETPSSLKNILKESPSRRKIMEEVIKLCIERDNRIKGAS